MPMGPAWAHWGSSAFLIVVFSRSVMSNSLQPYGLQHARLPYPSLSPRVCSDSCPLSQWCYLILSSSALFSFLGKVKFISTSSFLVWAWALSPSKERVKSHQLFSVCPPLGVGLWGVPWGPQRRKMSKFLTKGTSLSWLLWKVSF